MLDLTADLKSRLDHFRAGLDGVLLGPVIREAERALRDCCQLMTGASHRSLATRKSDAEPDPESNRVLAPSLALALALAPTDTRRARNHDPHKWISDRIPVCVADNVSSFTDVSSTPADHTLFAGGRSGDDFDGAPARPPAGQLPEMAIMSAVFADDMHGPRGALALALGVRRVADLLRANMVCAE